MAVALEQLPPLDLREAAQALDFELLRAPLKLREVLLDPGVGELGRGSRPATTPG